jgi:hypothetical protein
MRIRRGFLAWALLVALPGAGVSAATLEGTWVLETETYGAGGLDLARNKPELSLAFVRDGGTLAGRIRLAPDAAQERWPISGGRELELGVAPTQDAVRAHYLTPENDERFRLEVVEEYRVADDGALLVGTMRVTFLEAGSARGSFVLHRTFKRRS